MIKVNNEGTNSNFLSKLFLCLPAPPLLSRPLPPPAGIVGMCSVPAVAIRRSRCQASSCSSPVVCVGRVSATCRLPRRLWRSSWTNPSRPAPTDPIQPPAHGQLLRTHRTRWRRSRDCFVGVKSLLSHPKGNHVYMERYGTHRKSSREERRLSTFRWRLQKRHFAIESLSSFAMKLVLYLLHRGKVFSPTASGRCASMVRKNRISSLVISQRSDYQWRSWGRHRVKGASGTSPQDPSFVFEFSSLSFNNLLCRNLLFFLSF